MKLQTHGLSYFNDKIKFGEDAFQNVFVYQWTLDALELKKMMFWLWRWLCFSWKWKRAFTYKLRTVLDSFLA